MRSDPPVRRPRISRPVTRTAVIPLMIGLLFVGTAVFAKMVDARGELAESALGLPPVRMKSIAAPNPLPKPQPVTAAAFVPRGTPVLLAATPAAATYYGPRPARLPGNGLVGAKPEADRFGGSALVLDLFTNRPARAGSAAMGQDQPAPGPDTSAARSDPTGDAIAAANAASPQASSGTGNERFSQRVGSKAAEASQAQQLQNLDRLIPQGTIVSAVMETALNSDLPGFARALVTKDVLSFDGSAVLIPSHKSHFDYLLLSWVFYAHDLALPHDSPDHRAPALASGRMVGSCCAYSPTIATRLAMKAGVAFGIAVRCSVMPSSAALFFAS